MRVYVCISIGCSRVYEQEYGYLKSPGWPDVYPHNIECSIVLQAPQNSSISLFFTSFDVEGHTSCNYDYLEVSVDQTPADQTKEFGRFVISDLCFR